MENERKWRRIRFARNLVALIEGTGLTRTQFAEKAKVPFPWLQRATTGGITRLDRRGREHLDKIAGWFGVTEVERLWDRDFVAPPPWKTREVRAGGFAEDLRRLILNRGEEAEPLGTILRLMREATEGGGYSRSAGSSVPPPESAQAEHASHRPVLAGPPPVASGPPTAPSAPGRGCEATRPAGGPSGGPGLEAAHLAMPRSDFVPKKPSAGGRSGVAYRRRMEGRSERLSPRRTYDRPGSVLTDLPRCVECERPGACRCPKCGEPLCGDCLASYRSCEGCTPGWFDEAHAGDAARFCGYCGREDVESECDKCGERLCPECLERGDSSGDDFYCEACAATFIPIGRTLAPADLDEDREGVDDDD